MFLRTVLYSRVLPWYRKNMCTTVMVVARGVSSSSYAAPLLITLSHWGYAYTVLVLALLAVLAHNWLTADPN